MKKAMKIFLICIAAIFAAYIGEAVYISAKIHMIVKSSYVSFGGDNPYSPVVSDEIYNRMCYRNGYPLSAKDTTNATEVNKLSFPLTIHWLYGGKSIYWYTYEIQDATGVHQWSSWDIPVTITTEWRNGKLVISQYHEDP